MTQNPHARAEILAGAIALGEATDDERREYRRHLASCPSCLKALGGEHEVERTAHVVAQARESEVWEPDLGPGLAERMTRRRRSILRVGVSVLGICFAVAFCLHVLIVDGLARITPTLAAPLVINYGGARFVLEQQRSAVSLKPTPMPRHMVVTHNVIQIARAPVSGSLGSARRSSSRPNEIANIVVHPALLDGHSFSEGAPKSGSANPNLPVWRRDQSWTTVAKTTTTAVSETAPQPQTEQLSHAEQSIQINAAYTTREAEPIGGMTAIAPQLSPIANEVAQDENAYGTVVFEVLIDEHGMPTKCVITKSSNYNVLDDSVCKAAMAARYTPKTVGGHPEPGVYRDAFTFEMTGG